MGGRYLVTGVQLSLLKLNNDLVNREEIIDNILEEQFVGHSDKYIMDDVNKLSMDDISFCNGCNCMTHSIREKKLQFICGKCGHEKTLSDILQHQLVKEDD